MKPKFILPFFLTLTLLAIAQQDPGKRPLQSETPSAGAGLAGPPTAGDPFLRTKLEPLPGQSASRPVNIYGFVEYIEVPRDLWLSYSMAQPVGSDGTALRAEVQKWIDAGKAKPFELTCIATKSGSRTVIESIVERRYPIEFEPIGKTPFPTSFETRNTHFTFEWEPVCGPDSRTVNSQFVPQITRIAGYTFQTPLQRNLAQPGDVNQPLVANQRATLSITSESNQTVLLEVATPFHDNGKARDEVRQLTFFRAAVVPLTEPEKGLPEQIHEIMEGESRTKMTQKQVDDLLNDPSKDPASVRRRESVRSQIANTDTRIRARMFMFEIERLEVSLSDLSSWFAGKDLETATGELRKSALEWIRAGRGRELDRRTGPVKSGNRHVWEAIFEVRYPTGYEAEPIISPSTYETRNTGLTVELEPSLGPDGKIIDVSIVPQDVRHCANAVVHRTEVDGKAVADMEQPVFATMKLSTMISTVMGQYALLGINTPVGEDSNPDPDRRILTFIVFRP
jgi:hypothetical protein